MFMMLTSQRVRDDSGFVVQVSNQETAEYFEPNLKVAVTIEFGVKVGIYPETLRALNNADKPVELAPEKKTAVIQSIAAGLAAMGVEAVVF